MAKEWMEGSSSMQQQHAGQVAAVGSHDNALGDAGGHASVAQLSGQPCKTWGQGGSHCQLLAKQAWLELTCCKWNHAECLDQTGR